MQSVQHRSVQYTTVSTGDRTIKVPLPIAAVDGLSARIFLNPAMFVMILKKSLRQSHRAVSETKNKKKNIKRRREEKRKEKRRREKIQRKNSQVGNEVK